MEKLRDDHGLPTVRRSLRFLAIRLASRPASAALAEEIDAERDALASCSEDYEGAFEERVACSAEVSYLDAELGTAVADLARDVNALVKGNAEDPRYKRVFLGPPSERMKPTGGAEQDLFVANILKVLASDADFTALRHHVTTIGAWQTQLTAASTRREALQLAEAGARRELDIATAKSRKTYNHMEHRIAVLFPDSPALVESFFRAPRAPVPTEAAPIADPAAPRGDTPASPQQPANENAAPAATSRVRSARRRRVA